MRHGASLASWSRSYISYFPPTVVMLTTPKAHNRSSSRKEASGHEDAYDPHADALYVTVKPIEEAGTGQADGQRIRRDH